MTLEPVHMHKISELVKRIDSTYDPDEQEKAVDIYELLKELKVEGKVVLQAIGRLYRGTIRTDLMAQCEDPYPLTYACDSGSTNPMTYDNGVFVDFCHCALTATPTNLDLHRYRTIVCSTYSSSLKMTMPTSSEWESFDDGWGRAKLIKIEADELEKRIPDLVHSLCMYLAESEHILFMLGKTDPSGFFIMDGPLYPKQLMYWMVLSDKEIKIKQNKYAQVILQNYINIIDHFLEEKNPVIGFVKNPADVQIMNALRKQKIPFDLPWVLDSQFFKNFLSIKNAKSSPNFSSKGWNSRTAFTSPSGKSANGYISYTNWFLQPNRFYERFLNLTSPFAVENSFSSRFLPEDYAICFFMIYEPVKEVIFKIEAPYGLIKHEQIRQAIQRKIFFDLSVNRFPITLFKADNIAKIRKVEKEEIDTQFINMNPDLNYNDFRWDSRYEM
jgi:hypothetical protein